MMSNKEEILDMFIVGIVDKCKPKNEEIIHSGVFLLSKKNIEIPVQDWRCNGFSVISDTISTRMKSLFQQNLVSFSERGKYSLLDYRKFSAKETDEIKTIIDKEFSKYNSSLQILNTALEVYRKQQSKKDMFQ